MIYPQVEVIMLAEALTVRSKPVAQGVLVIDLAGMLNSTSQDPLMKACRQGWIQGGRIFLLNFHDVICAISSEPEHSEEEFVWKNSIATQVTSFAKLA